MIRLTIGLTPSMTMLLEFLDEMDKVGELCNELPEWIPERDEIIKHLHRMQDMAVKLCHQRAQDMKDLEDDDKAHESDESEGEPA